MRRAASAGCVDWLVTVSFARAWPTLPQLVRAVKPSPPIVDAARRTGFVRPLHACASKSRPGPRVSSWLPVLPAHAPKRVRSARSCRQLVHWCVTEVRSINRVAFVMIPRTARAPLRYFRLFISIIIFHRSTAGRRHFDCYKSRPRAEKMKRNAPSSHRDLEHLHVHRSHHRTSDHTTKITL